MKESYKSVVRYVSYVTIIFRTVLDSSYRVDGTSNTYRHAKILEKYTFEKRLVRAYRKLSPKPLTQKYLQNNIFRVLSILVLETYV